MPSTPQQILDELKKGILHPLYFLQGAEPFFIDQVVRHIEENALEPSERSFNQQILYGKDTQMGYVIAQARSFPMMAQRKVVIVKEAQELSDLGKQDAQDLLAKYAAQPVPSTILVFAHKYKKLDGRKDLAKILDKKAILCNSEPVADYKLNEWITGYLKSIRMPAGGQAVQMLADHLGNDLGRIANELEKIRISLPEGAELTRELIHEKIGISKEFNVFEFQAALASRNLARSMQIANYFVSNPKAGPIIQVLTILFGYFTKVLQTHLNDKMADKDLAVLLGVNPFFVKDYRSAKTRFSQEQLLHILHQIRLADGYTRGLESGSRQDEDIFKDLIIQIVRC